MYTGPQERDKDRSGWGSAHTGESTPTEGAAKQPYVAAFTVSIGTVDHGNRPSRIDVELPARAFHAEIARRLKDHFPVIRAVSFSFEP